MIGSHSSESGGRRLFRLIVVRWVVCTIAMWLSIYIVNEGFIWLSGAGVVDNAHLQHYLIQINGILGPVLFVAVLSMLNLGLRPVIRVLACPLDCLLFGAASLLIHALIFYFVGNHVPGLRFPSFLSACFASVLYSALAGVIILVTRGAGPRRR